MIPIHTLVSHLALDASVETFLEQHPSVGRIDAETVARILYPSPLRWWQCSLIGGLAIAATMIPGVAAAIAKFRPVPWNDLASTFFGASMAGALAGTVVGFLRRLSDWFTWLGDALGGAAAGAVFLSVCAILEQPDQPYVGWGMAFIGGIVGAVAGIFHGMDWRREARQNRASFLRTLLPPET